MKADELLWALSRRVEPDSEGPMRDDVLLAYRAGELSAAEQAVVERQLATSTVARRRLIGLAGVRTNLPPAVTSRAPLRSKWLGLAAAVILTLGLGSFWRASVLIDPAEVAQLAGLFNSQVAGIATERSHAESIQVQPETMVTVLLEPIRSAVQGVEFGLYRLEGLRALRVPERELQVERGRGSASFRVRASTLVPEQPGTHKFLAVVAPSGWLRPSFSWSADESPLEAVSEGGIRFVVEHPLEMGRRQPGG